MNRRKFYISPWLQLGIASLLLAGCLLTAVGVTFARYRVQQQASIIFQPEQNAMVFLGTVSDGVFSYGQSAWQGSADGAMGISFAVSNGKSADYFAQADQLVRVRLTASLGAWSEDGTNQLVLQVDGVEYIATAERIEEGSVLYSQFGDGWEFRFLDESGEELTWSLPGAGLSFISMQMQFGEKIEDTSLLQLQVSAENI